MNPPPGPGNPNDPHRSMPHSREEYGGHPPSRASPLEPLDTIIFNESELSREEFSQRYMENTATGTASYPQAAAQNANLNPTQEYSQRREQDPGQRAGYGYPSESALRPGRPQDPPSASAGDPPRHWSSHLGSQQSQGHLGGYPPRHGAGASSMHQQDAWHGAPGGGGRDASLSSTTSQPSPQRRMLPQQYDNQYAPAGLHSQPPRPGPAHSAGPVEGYPYSPQPSYGGYAPQQQYYPPQRLYQESFAPDPRNLYAGNYPHSYPGGYYEQQQRFMPNRNPLEGPYRNDFIHGPYGSSIQSQVPHPFGAAIPFIKEVNENDVLCGRGGATNSHAGNRSYRDLVKSYKDKYLKAKKKQKPNVAAEVVTKIRSLDPPGRFLKKDKETGWYLDIGDARAKEKTSQALREGAPLIRKQMSEGKRPDGTSSDDGATPEKPAQPSSGESEGKEERKISGDEAISAFSPHQPSVEKSDVESVALNPPDNRGEPAADKEERKAKAETTGEVAETSKKRSSTLTSEEAKETGESPMKRKMTGEGPVKREDPFRDVFEPPRASSIRKDDEKEKKKEKVDEKEKIDDTTDKAPSISKDAGEAKDEEKVEEKAKVDESNTDTVDV